MTRENIIWEDITNRLRIPDALECYGSSLVDMEGTPFQETLALAVTRTDTHGWMAMITHVEQDLLLFSETRLADRTAAEEAIVRVLNGTN